MRKTVLFIMMVLVASQVNAQRPNFNEWFKQKKTQMKYLLEQIAALQVYINYARKGYEITQNGLGFIRNIKKGDFNLHDKYFSSLKIVNPKIKGYVKVAAAISFQTRIVKETGKALHAMRESGQFTPEEVRYVGDVTERLLSDCLNCINELYLVITTDQLELKDDERITHIDRLYDDMQNKYLFCATFNEEIGVLAMQRKLAGIEVNYSKILNQVP